LTISRLLPTAWSPLEPATVPEEYRDSFGFTTEVIVWFSSRKYNVIVAHLPPSGAYLLTSLKSLSSLLPTENRT
jgi:hypothetical protein